MIPLPFRGKGCEVVAVITEYDLRQLLKTQTMTELIVEPNTIITPSAKGFLTEQGIELKTRSESEKEGIKEASQTTSVPADVDLNDSVRLLQIKWRLFQLEVVKTQREAFLVKSPSLGNQLATVSEIVAHLIDSLASGRLMEDQLGGAYPELDLSVLSYDSSALALSMVNLTLRAEEMEILMTQFCLDGFGKDSRPDIKIICQSLRGYLADLTLMGRR